MSHCLSMKPSSYHSSETLQMTGSAYTWPCYCLPPFPLAHNASTTLISFLFLSHLVSSHTLLALPECSYFYSHDQFLLILSAGSSITPFYSNLMFSFLYLSLIPTYYCPSLPHISVQCFIDFVYFMLNIHLTNQIKILWDQESRVSCLSGDNTEPQALHVRYRKKWRFEWSFAPQSSLHL